MTTLAPCALVHQTAKIFLLFLSQKGSQREKPNFKKRCFACFKANWVTDTFLSNFSSRSEKTQQHFTTFFVRLKNCWVSLSLFVYTFHPFSVLKIINKYVGGRITLLKRKQEPLSGPMVFPGSNSLLLSLLLTDVHHAPRVKHESHEVFNFVMTVYNLT